jgi:hypothetical protein
MIPESRHHEIECVLRQRITSRRYAAGTRIPTRRKLIEEFSASALTLQRALDRLVELGFLVAKGAHGTFVCDQLPHQSTFAIVFADVPDGDTWNRFWGALLRESNAWTDGMGRRFEPYCLRGANASCAEYGRLAKDVADGLVAGILFTSRTYWLKDSPVLRAKIPRVVLGKEVDEVAHGMSIIDLELPEERLWSAFARHDRKRVAIVCNLNQEEAWQEQIAFLRVHHLTTRSEWLIGLPTDHRGARAARRVTRLLMSGRAEQRPDALLISDDNLVPHATAGIQDAGLHAPQDVVVLAHANFPNPTHSAVSCLRYGPDITKLLHKALDEMERVRQAGASSSGMRFPMDIRDTEG